MKNNIKEIRSAKCSVSQSRLSSLTGIPQTTLSCWERDIGEPTVTQAMTIANALNVSIYELFSHPQRQLRENDTQGNFNTIGNSGGSHSIAAAELSEVKSSEMVKASEDLQDGRADTPEGEKVLRLMRQTGGAALAV